MKHTKTVALISLVCVALLSACSSNSREVPTATATTMPAPTFQNPTEPTIDISVPEGREDDALSLRILMDTQNSALSSGNYDAFYETCAPDLKSEAVSSRSVEKLLNVLPSNAGSLEFEYEGVVFESETSATVVFALKLESGEYFAGASGGQFVKVSDRWYSMSKGCI